MSSDDLGFVLYHPQAGHYQPQAGHYQLPLGTLATLGSSVYSTRVCPQIEAW
jgi:hypothetical protein